PLQVFEPGQYLVAGELLGQRADLPGVVIEFLGCEDRCVLGRPQQEPAPMHPRLDLAHSRTLLIAAISPYPALPRSLRTRVLPRALRTRTLRSEEHTSELQSRENLVCRLLLEKKKNRR